MIKISREALVHPIAHLINQCFRTKRWPNKWKINKILSLFKNKGERTDIKNYRPIALLSPISKLAEKEIQLQVNEFMKKNKLWNSDMNAYREHFSTVTALIDILETWTGNIDANYQNISVFLDLSSAFDCVKSSVILKKMEVYGFGPDFCELMDSYLSHRSQMVMVNGKLSDYRSNKVGVPQGSILGPLLFNLYVNELPSICHLDCNHNKENDGLRDNLFGDACDVCGRFITFADDSSIILRGWKGEDVKLGMEIDTKLVSISDFLAANNLKMNIDKTELIRVASRQQHSGNRGERILLEATNNMGERISPSNNAKILGILFMKTMVWRDYLEVGKDAVILRLKKKLGALKFTCKYASVKAREKLAHGCIMSVLLYGIQVWGLHCKPTVLKRVQSVQTNTLKWITGNYRWSLRALLEETKWMSIFQLAIYHSVLLYWKVKNHKEPERLIRRLNISSSTEARILLTDRVWSRKSEYYYRQVEPLCVGLVRLSQFKRTLSEWIRSNIPIYEE